MEGVSKRISLHSGFDVICTGTKKICSCHFFFFAIQKHLYLMCTVTCVQFLTVLTIHSVIRIANNSLIPLEVWAWVPSKKVVSGTNQKTGSTYFPPGPCPKFYGDFNSENALSHKRTSTMRESRVFGPQSFSESILYLIAPMEEIYLPWNFSTQTTFVQFRPCCSAGEISFICHSHIQVRNLCISVE